MKRKILPDKAGVDYTKRDFEALCRMKDKKEKMINWYKHLVEESIRDKDKEGELRRSYVLIDLQEELKEINEKLEEIP